MTEDTKPLRERKTWDSKFQTFYPVRDRYSEQVVGAYHRKYFPDDRLAFATEIITRFALVAAKPDGEDSAGRAKLALQEPQVIVDFACDVATKAFAKFEELGWLQPMPTVDEAEEASRINSSRN